MTTTTPIPVYLLITAGRTDLKILVRSDNANDWLPVDTGIQNCRNLHQWMLDNPERWTVAAPSVVEFEERRILDDNPQQRLPQGMKLLFTADNNLPLEVQGGRLAVNEEKLLFIAPKLGEVVEQLKKAAEYGYITFRGALVLYTHRDAGHEKAAEEPIALGLALARWIAETFNINYAKLGTLETPDLEIAGAFQVRGF